MNPDQPSERHENISPSAGPGEEGIASDALSPGSAPAGIRRHLGIWRPEPGETILSIGLLLVLVFGILLRFSWTNWHQGTNLHPDEYGLTGTLTQLSIPESLGDYFNTSVSPISPYQKYDPNGNPTVPGPDNRMRWGQWPIILIRASAELLDQTGYDQIRMLGRRMSALMDVLTLLLIYAIGSRLYGWKVGLLASALSALVVMQIQQSHFMTVDNFAVFFATLAMYAAVRIAEGAPKSPPDWVSPSSTNAIWSYVRTYRWLWFALFGIALGMALASRINLIPLAGMVLVAAYLAWSRAEHPSSQLLIIGLAAGVVLAGAFTLLTFKIAQPMSFRAAQGTTTFLTLTPNPDWVESMRVASSESRGIGGGPPGEQWTNRLLILFPLTNMVLWGMGLPLGILVWAGFVYAALQIFRKHPNWRAHLLLVIWSGGFFLFMGTRWVKSMRYFLTIYPFLILLGAWLIVELWNRGKPHLRFESLSSHLQKPASRLNRSQILSLVLGMVVVLGTGLWAWGFMSAVYRQDHTRIQASEWIYQNVPAAVNIRISTDDGIYSEPMPAGYEVQIDPGQPLLLQFKSPVDGELVGVTFGHAKSLQNEPVNVRVLVARNQDGKNALVAARVPVGPAAADSRGEPASAEFLQGEIEQNQTYYVLLEAESGPVSLSGSVVANESWDEGLPLRLGGRDGFGQFYRGLTNEVRWPDDQNKRDMFLDVLEEADFLILPSQRAIWSTSRLPRTYPMTMAYYRALFAGELGFDQSAAFQAPIEYAGIYISDVGGTLAINQAPKLPLFNDNLLAAEEAFSVYDHPPVWIFEKRSDFELDQVQSVLNSVDLEQVVVQGPREATQSSVKTLLQSEDQRQIQTSGGTWSELFNPESALNRSSPLAVTVWWGSIILLGFIALPLTWLAFPGLQDRGYPIARLIGLLLVSWLAWVLSSTVLRFTRGTIALSLLILFLGSALILWRKREQLWEYLRQYKWEILAVELLALGFFLFVLWIRYGNPDLWHRSMGGEKPMNFSYLNAVLKSDIFPPFDPWYAGGYINYYYFGYVIIGSWIKLLGITPSVAYNLVIPTLFSFAALGAYSIGFNLLSSLRRRLDSLKTMSPRIAGLLAALALVLLGNLGTLRMIYDGFEDIGSQINPETGEQAGGLFAVVRGAGKFFSLEQGLPYGLHEWYWNPSRAIPPGEGEAGPITEFPFFTFIYADLHAHMIGLPLTIACMVWIISLVLAAQSRKMRWSAWIAPFFIGALLLGSLRPTNTWDYPVYWGLGALAVLAVVWLQDKKLGLTQLVKAIATSGLLFLAAYLLYYPYHYWYGQGYTSAELWGGSRTNLSDYLTVHGLFVFLILLWFIWETRDWMVSTPISALSRAKANLGYLVASVILLLGLIILLTLSGYWILPIVSLISLWAGVLFLRPGQALEKRIILVFIAVGAGLTLLVEIVVLRGDISRMNTVFKFYYQVWSLFSVSAAFALVLLLGELEAMDRRFRRIWIGFAIFLIVGAALYPVTAASAKVRDRMEPAAPKTLDGMRFMQDATYYDLDRSISLEGDYQAIRWMMENVEGSPVIVEANLPEYRWGTRYTIYTGLPGVLGWNWHQRQQRVSVPNNDVFERAQQITDFYMTRDVEQAWRFLESYDIEYIVLGELERLYFENLYQCRPAEDSDAVNCDLSGLPVGMLQPQISAAECSAENPDDPQSRLICPTHALDKFQTMEAQGLIKPVFSSGATTIFKVVQ